MGRPLTIAVPKGRPLLHLADLLDRAGLSGRTLREESRRLLLEDTDAGLNFILSKPTDVPTYVEYGAADLGIAGKDVIMEAGRDVSELLDLRFSRCRMIVAVPKDSGVVEVDQLGANCRVATKYPRIATAYFNQLGLQVEVIPLHGSIELGPIVGLSDAIVDITETGRTLVENGLAIIATIADISARLIANRISHRTEYERIEGLVSQLRGAVQAAQVG